jgi:hypothetical protein
LDSFAANFLAPVSYCAPQLLLQMRASPSRPQNRRRGDQLFGASFLDAFDPIATMMTAYSS